MAEYAVCLNSNIMDETKTKRLRGETFEATATWVESIIEGDRKAGRQERVCLVNIPKKTRGRPKKDASDD